METIQSAQMVLFCSSLDETVNFFKNRLGFRTDTISPADDPSVVVISEYGLSIRLERNTDQLTQSSSTIRLLLKQESDVDANETMELIAPNGTKIQLVKTASKLSIPAMKQSFVVSRMSADAPWVKGRAGMNYRDLIPGRQGGRFIASQIQIPNGGPVNDHVHYHNIRFQMIYVYKGWVRLVYEDQGQSFVLHAGDCVLQPPLIRHRVLESSPGLEVVEVACPAVHDTYIDHNMELPNADQQFDRTYGGQRFVKYIATKDEAQWQPWRLPGFEYRDIGIDAATEGLAGVKIIRSNGDIQLQACQHSAEFVFIFVLTGQLSFHIDGQIIEILTDGDAFVLPENLSYTFTDWSNDLRLLEVSLPGTFSTILQ
jgi:quercetin dioxygenase-like cupin family protein